MSKKQSPVTILLAEDDPDDRMVVQEAFDENNWANPLHFVEDGEELLDYLRQRGRYASGASSPRPSLILLDLNMPKKNGREALQEIKTDPALRQIPVVVLTTSKAESDISCSYDLGVNSYITKPAEFSSLVATINGLREYWFETVTLPRREV